MSVFCITDGERTVKPVKYVKGKREVVKRASHCVDRRTSRDRIEPQSDEEDTVVLPSSTTPKSIFLNLVLFDQQVLLLSILVLLGALNAKYTG